MKRPFNNQEERNSLQAMLDSFKMIQEQVNELRANIHEVLDAEDGIDGQDCTCIAEELEGMESTLFGVGNVLHVYGCQLLSHVKQMDVHEAHKEVIAKIMETGRIGPVGIGTDKKDLH